MYIIGVTGGVGAGKSTVLDYLEHHYKAKVIQADEIGHQVMDPGGRCYSQVLDLFGNNVKNPDLTIDRKKISDIVFLQKEKLEQLNAIIHPAVRAQILEEIEAAVNSDCPLVVVESALLLEVHYEEFCDETWYIHAEIPVRIRRLMESRGYTKEKSESIIRRQASEDYFRAHTDVTIENNEDLAKTYRQIDERIRKR